MRILTIICIAIFAVSCAKKKRVVSDTSNSTGLDITQTSSIEYNESIDRVEIKAFNGDGDATTIKFFGVRIDAENMNHDKAVEVCSMLGFTKPEKASYTTVKSGVRYYSSNYHGKGIMDHSEYPALDMKVEKAGFSSLFFDYIPKITTHYFTTPTWYQCFQKQACDRIVGRELDYAGANEVYDQIRYKNYLSSISCEGTTQIHFNNEQTFNEDKFIRGVFEGLMAKEIEDGNNHYSMGYPFLVGRASEYWHIATIRDGFGTYKGGNARVKEDFLPHAEAGALDICKKSGYDQLLFYNVQYKNSAEVVGNVYEFVDGVWQERLAPAKFVLKGKERDGTGDKIVEMPNIYLGDVICI